MAPEGTAVSRVNFTSGLGNVEDVGVAEDVGAAEGVGVDRAVSTAPQLAKMTVARMSPRTGRGYARGPTRSWNYRHISSRFSGGAEPSFCVR